MQADVMIIEDDVMLAKLYSEGLRSAGFNVKHLYNPLKNDIRKIFKNNLKVIVLDIILGKINGFEVLKEIKKNPFLMNIPIIIVTGLDTTEVRVHSELRASLGISGIYTKTQLPIEKFVKIVADAAELNK